MSMAAQRSQSISSTPHHLRLPTHPRCAAAPASMTTGMGAEVDGAPGAGGWVGAPRHATAMLAWERRETIEGKP